MLMEFIILLFATILKQLLDRTVEWPFEDSQCQLDSNTIIFKLWDIKEKNKHH